MPIVPKQSHMPRGPFSPNIVELDDGLERRHILAEHSLTVLHAMQKITILNSGTYSLTDMYNFALDDSELDGRYALILADATYGTVTITLADVADYANRRFMIKKIDSTRNKVYIKREGTTALIDGEKELIINDQNTCAEVLSDGTDWHLI